MNQLIKAMAHPEIIGVAVVPSREILLNVNSIICVIGEDVMVVPEVFNAIGKECFGGNAHIKRITVKAADLKQ